MSLRPGTTVSPALHAAAVEVQRKPTGPALHSPAAPMQRRAKASLVSMPPPPTDPCLTDLARMHLYSFAKEISWSTQMHHPQLSSPVKGLFSDTSKMSSPANDLKVPEPNIPTAPSTSGTIASTRAPLYKVAPVTKILVEPSKALKSPFLVKRQSFRRPDANVLEDLYTHTISVNHAIDTTTPIDTMTQIPRFKDFQKLVEVGGRMNNLWLNFAVSKMVSEDAQDLWNNKCLGWRHYVDSNWAERSLSRCLDPDDLKNLFYPESAMYNASQSHMVFIPVFHDAHWTLYAFNMCDQKLSILDSLPDTTKGVNDTAERHQKTRFNVCDALTVTMNFAIDFRSWEYQFPKVPRQQNRDDCGFFVFNFMRLWDGHQLVRWFPIESRELRKDFLAYILLCKDNDMHLPHPISSRIKDLPGKMMDCTVQKVARESATVCTENQGEHRGDRNGTDEEAPVESLNEHIGFSNCFEWGICFLNPYWKPIREAPSAMSSAPDHESAFSDFLGRCHQVTSDGDGVLHIAARFGNVEIVKKINTWSGTLAHVLLSAVNNRGDTTLHCAATGGSNVMVKFFLDDMMKNTDPSVIAKFLRAQNLKGETCLHEAVRHGYEEIVATLISHDETVATLILNDSSLQKKIDPLITEDLKSPTLVQIVDNEVKNEKHEIVDYVCGAKKLYGIFCQEIMKFKSILNTEDQDGNTALHLAIIKASENVIINASEKIFCTLMRNRAVFLNYANNEGHTPLDLAFLSLHPKVISMKGPREWIYFDLLHGGGSFGVCSWDSLAGTVVEPDWEKESERVSKSASMLAVCAVLILNIALLAPFNVLKQQDRNKPFNVVAFQTFVVSDSMAFVCSVAATFFCARAGFAMSDGWTRLKNLITGIYALGLAALALIITVGLALFLVLPGGTGFLPVIIAGFGIFSHLVLGFIGSWIKSTYAHLRAIRARAGILRVICILLFQRSAIQPMWVVPSGSISLLWSVAIVVAAFVITISATKTFGPEP
ncbi:unnamed protein product [Alopecurus aequalis]